MGIAGEFGGGKLDLHIFRCPDNLQTFLDYEKPTLGIFESFCPIKSERLEASEFSEVGDFIILPSLGIKILLQGLNISGGIPISGSVCSHTVCGLVVILKDSREFSEELSPPSRFQSPTWMG